MALEIGSRLGHYDVTALIGEGGMGRVYRQTLPAPTRVARRIRANLNVPRKAS